MKRKANISAQRAPWARAPWLLAVIALAIGDPYPRGIAAEMAPPHAANFRGKLTDDYPAEDHALAEEIGRWAQTELQIAQMAKEAGASAEIRALARTLVTYQVRMISALRELARRHGLDLSEAQPAPASGKHARFAGAKGPAFDRAFRENLRSDPAALQLFSRAAKNARNRDLRRLAESTLGELKSRRPNAAQAYFAEIEAHARKIAPKKTSTNRSKTTAKARKKTKAADSAEPKQTSSSRPSTTASVSADSRSVPRKPKKPTVTPKKKTRSSAAPSSGNSYSATDLRFAPRAKVVRRPGTQR